jgi:hypothetical protein
MTKEAEAAGAMEGTGEEMEAMAMEVVLVMTAETMTIHPRLPTTLLCQS